MKKIIMPFAMMLSAVAVFGQQKKFNDLIGRWEIVDKDEKASLQIIDSTNIILNYMGETKKIMNYKIDFGKSPIWFDFSTDDSVSSITVKTLLEIINDNTIKWQLFVDEDRPAYFSSSKGELFYLRKTKPDTNSSIVGN